MSASSTINLFLGMPDDVKQPETFNPPSLTNHVWNMKKETKEIKDEKFLVYTQDGEFTSGSMVRQGLIYDFASIDVNAVDEDHLFVYNVQASAVPPKPLKKKDEEKSQKKTENEKVVNPPPAYIQNICGVMQLCSRYPTKLDLNKSWLKGTGDNGKAYFYMVTKSGELK